MEITKFSDIKKHHFVVDTNILELGNVESIRKSLEGISIKCSFGYHSIFSGSELKMFKIYTNLDSVKVYEHYNDVKEFYPELFL